LNCRGDLHRKARGASLALREEMNAGREESNDKQGD
jgi:hypothetical protein